MKVYKDGERVRLKSEYEKFRSRTNPFIILAGILQLIFPRTILLLLYVNSQLISYMDHRVLYSSGVFSDLAALLLYHSGFARTYIESKWK